jgi:ribonuclease HI
MRREEKEVILYCDGQCEGVGDEAIGRYGYVIYHGRDKITEGEGEAGRGKEMTSNVAEYVAVLRGLEALRTWAGTEARPYKEQTVRVRSDSRLVMSQLGMLCVVRSPRLYPWWRKVKVAARGLEVAWEWVPRSWNREVDALTRR